MSHQVQAVALTCVDYRFRRPFQDFLAGLQLTDVDHIALAGGAKGLLSPAAVQDELFANFEIAFNKHGVERVILINHQDCGGYGGSSAFGGLDAELDFQRAQLRQAVSTLGVRYPEKQIEAYLGRLNDAGEVSFEKVI
jgi:carbonic anhydrase